MEETILREIVQELKGLRGEVVTTNKRLDETVNRLDGLQREATTTNKRLDGLHESFVVLQQEVANVRYELHNIKEILSDRVIWQNDSIAIATREGNVIYGVINKTPKK